MLLPVAWMLASYLLGSLPVGILLARMKGQDPRRVGSGNMGATNVMRAAGRILGVLTLLGDILKGFLPAWLALRFGQPGWVVAGVGLAAFAGHLFPLYLRFKGGKGVATALGVFLALSPPAVLMVVPVFAAVLLLWGYVSLGSLVGAALMPLAFLGLNAPLSSVVSCAIMAVSIFVRHRENIKQLMSGKEHRILRKGRS